MIDSSAERREQLLSSLSGELEKIRALAQSDPKEADYQLLGFFEKARDILPATALPENQGRKPNEFIELGGAILYRELGLDKTEVSILSKDELRQKAENSLPVIEGVMQDLAQRIRDLKDLEKTLRKAAGLPSKISRKGTRHQ